MKKRVLKNIDLLKMRDKIVVEVTMKNAVHQGFSVTK
jgi:hypothetical protein